NNTTYIPNGPLGEAKSRLDQLFTIGWFQNSGISAMMHQSVPCAKCRVGSDFMISRQARLSCRPIRNAVLVSAALLASCAGALTAIAGEGTGAWRQGPEGPQPRSETAVAADGERAYLVGDYIDATEILIYDAATGQWAIGPDLEAHVHHPMAAA